MELETKNPEKVIKKGKINPLKENVLKFPEGMTFKDKRNKPRHKHWFQFVEKYNEYSIVEKETTGKTVAEFVCICGIQKMVSIKESLNKNKEGISFIEVKK